MLPEHIPIFYSQPEMLTLRASWPVCQPRALGHGNSPTQLLNYGDKTPRGRVAAALARMSSLPSTAVYQRELPIAYQRFVITMSGA